ncbi:hypothetical protein N7532_000886 [Penicillium argentinense]|uniref:Uncharacterized protein n=1 Tax=Penicillium argentinense TaxID=1131581 RepID=A0A9W9G647_9EURO|nr:uncharacterized protein N7532_000886 [Penicillium argentinense]KAJ5112841.1 hypothetical protein N7532_000886 [Penicillium argentinense]
MLPGAGDNSNASTGSDAGPSPNEHTSLLPEPAGHAAEAGCETGEKLSSRGQVVAEFGALFTGSVPVILAYTLQMSLQTVAVIIVGRSSPMNLAVSAFSFMFALVTGWMIGLGGTTALDTLAASAYTGSENKHALGILLQRAFLVLGGLFLPVAVVWACSRPIFQALGQDPELSAQSARFLTCLIPAGLGYIYFEVMKKYLQAQGEIATAIARRRHLLINRAAGIMRAGTYVLLVISPLNAGLTYFFCYTLEMGLLGAPLAADMSYWSAFLLLVLYARLVSGSECWGGWSREAFDNAGAFTRLALLGILQVGSEWWAAEIMALCAGNVIMTADQILNTIPFGIGVTTSARIGNLLGMRDAKGAARAAHLAVLLSVLLGTLVFAVLMGTRTRFAMLFNEDPDVVRLTAEVLPVVALFQIADGICGSCGGVLRGTGRQHLGVALNVLGFYCFAVPLGIALAFHGWGLGGLWTGLCIALWSVGALEWTVVVFTRWDDEVRRAFQRMDSPRVA